MILIVKRQGYFAVKKHIGRTQLVEWRAVPAKRRVEASQVHTAATTYGMGMELDVIAAVFVGGTNLVGGSGRQSNGS